MTSEALCPICNARVELVDGIVPTHTNKRLLDNPLLSETYKQLEISTDCIGAGMSAKGLRNANFGLQFGIGKEKLAKLATQFDPMSVSKMQEVDEINTRNAAMDILRSVLDVMLKAGWAVSALEEKRTAYNDLHRAFELLGEKR